MQYETTFDSLEALIGYAEAGRKAGRVTKVSDREGFIGRDFADWDAVMNAVRSEWKEGLDEFQYMLYELGKETLPEPKSSRRRARYAADGGDEVDNDRLRAGQDFWREMRRESHHAPQHITLFCDIGTRCYVASKDILWRGAVALVLADLLEKQGNRVELWMVSSQNGTYTNGRGSWMTTCLKRSEQPLDIVSLVNALSGWFYRTVSFQHRKAETRCRMEDGYGSSHSVSMNDERIQAIAGKNAYLISDLWDKNTAIHRAKEILHEIEERNGV